MKKIAFSLFLIASTCYAQGQETIQHSDAEIPKNEVKWNIGNTIAFGSIELGYEYFMDGSQSVGAEILMNDSYNYAVSRQYKDFDTHSFQLTYNYYMGSESNNSGLMLSPLLKYRFGSYQERESTPKINMNSLILGIGVGYKWNFSDKFVFGPYLNIGRNFSEKVNDEFSIAVEFNSGIGIGYRF
jgi:hypothetical protein